MKWMRVLPVVLVAVVILDAQGGPPSLIVTTRLVPDGSRSLLVYVPPLSPGLLPGLV